MGHTELTGISGFVWGVGTVLGPVVGGYDLLNNLLISPSFLLTCPSAFDKFNWRWAFYINLSTWSCLFTGRNY